MDIVFEDGLCLQEVLDYLADEEHHVQNIFIEPPDVSQLTDEDSGEEDGGGLIDNLCGKLLTSRAEVQFSDSPSMDLSEKPRMSDKTISNTVKTNHRSKKLSKYVVGKWILGDLEDNNALPFPQPDYSKFKGLTSVEIFEKFFSQNILEHLEQQIQLYSQFKNCSNPNISKEEIQCFIAILILSGYITYFFFIFIAILILTMCKKCDVGLCIDCFYTFHKK